jgi:hypothetical protein
MCVPRTADNIKIPLATDEALRLALKVKPTKDMPRPGTSGQPEKALVGTDRKRKP